MPVTVTIDRKLFRVAGAVTGPVGPAEVVAAFKTIFDHPEYEAGMTYLWDFRDANINLRLDGIHQILRFLDSHQKQRGVGREAILVSRDVDFGQGRMVESYTDTSPFTLRVFRDRDEALAWLHSED